MSKFRKRPIVIEAEKVAVLIRSATSDWKALPAWFSNAFDEGCFVIAPDHIVVRTAEGNMRAEKEDWIIQGVEGEVYPCKPTIFEATYEVVAG